MHSYIPSFIAILLIIITGIGWYWSQSLPGGTAVVETPSTATTTTHTATTTVSEATTTPPVAAKPDLKQDAINALLGKWKSSTDPAIIREFKKGDVFVDTHGSTTIKTGTWRIFVGEKAPAVTFETRPGHVYMTIIESGETKYAKVTNLTLTDLQLVFMDRPGMLFYSRVE